MALQFIFGGSGSGKSHYLYEHIIELSGKNPGQNYMVLVPEQFTMQTQRDLVLMHPNKGIMNIDVLSFGRLAYRIFEETGKGKTPVLDDEGKNLILRKIARNYDDRLKILKGNMKKPGYVSEVKSVLSEFVQYDIGLEELDRVIESASEGSSLSYKLQDIRLLYEGFQNYLKEKYITKEEILDLLNDALDESELIKNSVVVLDGFTGFTPVQNRLLAKLMRLCKDVIVTATIDDREDPYTYAHPYQLFALSKQMVSSLVELARNEKIKIEEPVILKDRPFYRFRESEALSFLERNLFRYGKEVFGKDQDDIELHMSLDPSREAMAAAAKVRSLVRSKECRYREVGVIVSNMDIYSEPLKRAFAKYEIPLFMDYKRSLLLNAFVEYVRSLLSMAEQNLTYESVFRFLRAGYTSFTEEELNALDNYVIAFGIKGYKKWQEKWIRRTDDMTEEELELVNHLRVTFVEELDDLLFVCKQRKKTVEDLNEALKTYFEKEGLRDRIEAQSKSFEEEGQLELAKEYEQIYDTMMELMDKFGELLGDEEVGMKEYEELLDAGLNEAKVGVIPPGLDEVVAGDLERTRMKDIKALLFLGANDTCLPGNLSNVGLLTERDREKFEKEKLNLTPGGKEKAYIQKFYLYLNLTKPSKYLYLSYSRMSSDGKSIRPAYLISEIQKRFPKIQVIDEENRPLAKKELTPNTAFADLVEGLKLNSAACGGAWMELYNWYRNHEEWAEKIASLLEAGFYQRPKDAISQKVAEQLYGKRFSDSVSRMETYSACAFAHFLSYGLRLQERQEYEFKAVDLGIILHAALENYAGKAAAIGKGWIGLSKEEQKELSDEALMEAISACGNSVLYSSSRNEHMITRMKCMMEKTVWALTVQLRRGDFTPEASEYKFASGKIDRVDTCDDEEELYLRIMDYKTGNVTFDASSLYYGLQLQLMYYMNAAMGLQQERHPDKEVIPAGVFYYRIQDPIVDRQENKEDEEKALLKALCPEGVFNLEKESLTHLERSEDGEYYAVQARKKKDGSLAAGSRGVEAEDFHTMTEYAKRKVDKIHREIAEGKAQISPYRKGQSTKCDFCQYRHICGFDEKIPGYAFRNLKQYSIDDAIIKMREELGGEA